MTAPSTPPRWQPLLDALPVPNTPALLAELSTRYAEPQRSYHGLAHIEALASLYLEVERGPGWRNPAEVKLAILFHDVIYEPGRPDNEARSAELAITWLREHPVDHERIAHMIRATKTHDTLDTPNTDTDLPHFLDADMAIIGTPPPLYDHYTTQVEHEFATIPKPLYQQGRAHFLRTQLARKTLFHTPYFQTRYEAQARQNLTRELQTLVHRF